MMKLDRLPLLPDDYVHKHADAPVSLFVVHTLTLNINVLVDVINTLSARLDDVVLRLDRMEHNP